MISVLAGEMLLTRKTGKAGDQSPDPPSPVQLRNWSVDEIQPIIVPT
jgi:hypothetical protein